MAPPLFYRIQLYSNIVFSICQPLFNQSIYSTCPVQSPWGYLSGGYSERNWGRGIGTRNWARNWGHQYFARTTFCSIGFFVFPSSNKYKCRGSEKNLIPYALIDFDEIVESSGIIKSKKYPGVFWTHNDSGDSARIFAITEDGKIIKPKWF